MRLADHRTIYPGDIFTAAEHEVPMAFRDTIKRLDAPTPEKPIVAVKVTYKLIHKGGGRYNILDNQGKVVNTKSLKKAEAEELIKTLEE